MDAPTAQLHSVQVAKHSHYLSTHHMTNTDEEKGKHKSVHVNLHQINAKSLIKKCIFLQK
jgi:hypothetical protein